MLESAVRISTGRTKLLELTGRKSVLELTGHTDFLVSTGHTILEFTGLLELTMCTFLLEYREGIGLRTSGGCTDLLELTGRRGLIESAVRISAESTKLQESIGQEVLELTGHSGLSK